MRTKTRREFFSKNVRTILVLELKRFEEPKQAVKM
jgi:hypothetical protein